MIRARLIIAAVLVLTLGIGSFVRADVFRDELTFWADAAAKSPNKARPQNNLGRTLMVAGRSKEAHPLIIRALTLDPDYLDARFNLAMLFYDSGLPGDAEREFSQIVERYPHTQKAAF